MNPPISKRESIEAEAARLLAVRDRLGQAWSSEQEAQLQAWLARDLDHRITWLRLQDAWLRADQLAQTAAPRPSLRGQPFWWPERWLPRWPVAAVASMLLVLVLVSLEQGRYNAPLAQLDAQPIATKAGERRSIALQDGSKVTLNARSRAHTEFASDSRQVWLDEGEAFFDVQPDPKRPFVVHAGKDRVVVLGTRFSVRRDGDTTLVLVQEGKVRVERAPDAGRQQAPLMLEAGAEASLQPESALLQQYTPEQITQALDWRQGRLTFKDRPLSEIAAEFNRYHQRQLIVDPATSDMRIGGSFDIDNLDGFARLMQEGFDLSVRVEGNELHLGQR